MVFWEAGLDFGGELESRRRCAVQMESGPFFPAQVVRWAPSCSAIGSQEAGAGSRRAPVARGGAAGGFKLPGFHVGTWMWGPRPNGMDQSFVRCFLSHSHPSASLNPILRPQQMQLGPQDGASQVILWETRSKLTGFGPAKCGRGLP